MLILLASAPIRPYETWFQVLWVTSQSASRSVSVALAQRWAVRQSWRRFGGLGWLRKDYNDYNICGL